MKNANYSSLCKGAELHYYDFICGQSSEHVPDYIIKHIEQCHTCQQQVEQLKKNLSQTEEPADAGSKRTRTAVTKLLELHFAYIGKHVTCGMARSFLPSLLDSTVQLKIPTPITAHLDNCRQCREDLETIRRFNLEQKQLWRLGRLLADRPAGDIVSCRQAKRAISSVAVMDWSSLDAQVLKHLCTCPVCRELLYVERQKICDNLQQNDRSPEFPCESISAPDIFDYCFPYGIDPAEGKYAYAKFRPALTSHLRDCSVCLAKMQQLHSTIYGIAGQPESGVITICTIDESTKAEVSGESDDLYAGFPIRVEAMEGEDQIIAEQSTPTADFTKALKQKAAAKNYRPLFKVGAAAAVILIAVALLVNTPTAGAVGIEQIYKAIEKIRNVYIAKFTPNTTKPKEELWVSRELNIYMIKIGSDTDLWDIGNHSRKTKLSDTGTIETIQLTEEKLRDIGQTMGGCLGLAPFENISDIPSDARWNRVTDDKKLEIVAGTEVYDLAWNRKARDGSLVAYKWRVFVEPKTSLPSKIEWYRKLIADTEYSLQELNVVKPLDVNEIQGALKESGF